MGKHHGMYGTPEWLAWKNMRDRCTKPNHQKWERYGGRGITVCDEWLHDFMAFYNHIGKRPAGKYSLDRIDNNGNYEPGNVRWATDSEQNKNRDFFNIPIHNSTGVRGVGWHKASRRWRARIVINGRYTELGNFKTITEAEEAIILARQNGR